MVAAIIIIKYPNNEQTNYNIPETVSVRIYRVNNYEYNRLLQSFWRVAL